MAMRGIHYQETRRERLRSRNSGQRAFAVFINKTRKNVTLEWLDFNGNHVTYKDRMGPMESAPLNTFVGHPWVFYETEFRHQLTALPDRKRIYMPQAYEGGRLIYRAVHIVSPVSTLQQLCLKLLHKHLVIANGECPDTFNQSLDKLEKDMLLLPIHRDQLKFLENSRLKKNLPIYVNVATDAD